MGKEASINKRLTDSLQVLGFLPVTTGTAVFSFKTGEMGEEKA